ncbi:MAG: Gfo/Idh/MocA family oxidoreductase, partial [Thermofilaceae archaeon]
LCEKPIALTLKDADTMISACERARSKLAVAHIRRYSGEYILARKLLASGVIGEVTFIHGAAVGDMLSDGTHLVDLAFFLAGDSNAEWVIGQVDLYEKRRRYGHLVEDAAIGYLKLSNGVKVFVETSQITGTQVPLGQFGFSSESVFKNLGRAKRINWWNRGIPYCSFYVAGSNGTLEVGEWNEPRLRYWGKGMDKWETPLIPQSDPFVEIIKDLVKSVEEDRQPLSSGFQARKTLEVLMAIFESARLRETVTLPLKIDYNPLFKLTEVDG